MATPYAYQPPNRDPLVIDHNAMAALFLLRDIRESLAATPPLTPPPRDRPRDPIEDSWFFRLPPARQAACEAQNAALASLGKMHSAVECVDPEHAEATETARFRAQVEEHIAVLRRYVEALEQACSTQKE